jgi:UDP:flavonoid glycosyltransferase YjiC (YdhE family)
MRSGSRAARRVLVAAIGEAGHLFPALALARALRARGNEVLVSSSERWRTVVEAIDVRFEPAPERIAFPGPAPSGDTAPGFAEAVRRTQPLLREFDPDVVVSDPFGMVPSVAAEVAGVPRATLIPQVWALYGPDRPPWSSGLNLPRTTLGSLLWRSWRLLESGPRRRGKALIDGVRAELGLEPSPRPGPAFSEQLVMVATFPQLELPRPRPAAVEVTGPMLFDLPHSEVELPSGDAPLVLVTASTGQDGNRGLLRTALEALAGEPVRVLASINERGASWPGPVPGNARVVDWVSYGQVMPHAAAVITRGGHGTIARALAEGVPLLICPGGGDMAENGTRVAWSGAGLMLPPRFLGRAPMRWSVRLLLSDRRYAARAGEIAAWAGRHDGAERGAVLIERRFGC